MRAVRAAVHDRAAVQLRRHRRAARAPRHGRHERQRQARDEPRRARPRAEGAQGPGPAAHPRRRATRSGTTPTAATSRTASGSRWSRDAAVNEDFNLSTAASTTVLELAEAIWHKVHGDERPFRYVSRPAVRARRADARPRRAQGDARCSASRRRRRSTTMLDEVIPWIRDELEAGRLDGRRSCSVVVPVYKEGETVEPVLRALDAGDHDAARGPRRLRLRRGHDGPGHRPARTPSSRRSAACATTSGAACSTR